MLSITFFKHFILHIADYVCNFAPGNSSKQFKRITFMDNKNIQVQRDLYFMVLNLSRRRLIVDDSFRLFQTPPQKKIYPSTGCLLHRCLFRFLTCDICSMSYNVLEL